MIYVFVTLGALLNMIVCATAVLNGQPFTAGLAALVSAWLLILVIGAPIEQRRKA